MERNQLRKLLNDRIEQLVHCGRNRQKVCPKMEAKRESFSRRNAEVVKVEASGKIKSKTVLDRVDRFFYSVHLRYLVIQKELFYIEEEVEERVADFENGRLVDDREILPKNVIVNETVILEESDRAGAGNPFKYDRLNAVKYAERWWNEYNPEYVKFENDCTNYISQCLHAGNAPMVGYPKRENGWWMRNGNWSYSWAVANALRWYLPNAKTGVRAREVASPFELEPGDVIFYDFQGDGRYDHTTIVTAKDANGMPLVNAHTFHSRMRYWDYRDSSAYTPNIKYKFFHIMDDFST